MRRLTPTPLTARSDRGASAVFVALTAVILFTIAAWVIDGSALFQERRELQNGADAAALAIAADCAVGNCSDANARDLTAELYADANATDGDSDVPPGAITFPTANSVKVQVRTVDADGNDLDGDASTVDYVFAGVIGKEGYEVIAAATAGWGSVSAGDTIPIIFSLCEFDRFTDPDGDGNRDFAIPPAPPIPPPPWNPGDTEAVIFFHLGSGNNGNGGQGLPDDCAAQAGQDTDGDDRLPGGFGWLQQDECIAHIEQDIWVGAKPGSGAPQDCDPDDLLDKILMIPIFNDVTEPGGGGFAGQCTTGPGGKCYRIDGFAAFYVTGFRFPGGQGWRQDPPCNPPDTCISGYFTDYVLPGSTGGGDNDFGAQTVWLIS